MNYEQEIEVLKSQVKELRIQVQRNWELLDTIATPPWKRLLFFLQGYRLWRVGKWYNRTEDLK